MQFDNEKGDEHIMEQRCGNYCGVECINGYCPKALRDEYMERGYDIVHNCGECSYYRGCEDCCFADKPDLCEPHFVNYNSEESNKEEVTGNAQISRTADYK